MASLRSQARLSQPQPYTEPTGQRRLPPSSPWEAQKPRKESCGEELRLVSAGAIVGKSCSSRLMARGWKQASHCLIRCRPPVGRDCCAAAAREEQKERGMALLPARGGTALLHPRSTPLTPVAMETRTGSPRPRRKERASQTTPWRPKRGRCENLRTQPVSPQAAREERTEPGGRGRANQGTPTETQVPTPSPDLWEVPGKEEECRRSLGRQPQKGRVLPRDSRIHPVGGHPTKDWKENPRQALGLKDY